MSETFVLIGPEHCWAYKQFLADRYSELGVTNARNIVGRIGNLYFRYRRVLRNLEKWEKARCQACQDLANSVDENRAYLSEDRPAILTNIKQARKKRDGWHYNAQLFCDIDKLFATLPVLYVTELELLEAKTEKTEKLLVAYRRTKFLRQLQRRQRSRSGR